MRKRVISLILCLVLFVSLLPARVAAADDYHNADGKINVIELNNIGTPALYCGGAMLPSVASATPVTYLNDLDPEVHVSWVKEELSEDGAESTFVAVTDTTFSGKTVYGYQILVRAAGDAVFADKEELSLAIYKDKAAEEPERIPDNRTLILSANAKSVTFLVLFGATAAEKMIIDRIDITGVTDPASGAAAVIPTDYSVEVPVPVEEPEEEETEPADPVMELKYAVSFEAAWLASDGSALSASDTFETDADYSLGFSVRAGENYMFSPNTAVFVNGKRVTNGLPVSATTQELQGVYEKQSDINNTVLEFDAVSYSDETAEEITIGAVLKDRDGLVMEGRSIALRMNGTTLTGLTTDADGAVSFTLLPEMDEYRVGSYSLTAVYAGEAGYEVSETSATLVIRGEEEETPVVTFELSDDETTGTLTGVDVNMKYSFDGEAFTDIEDADLEGEEPERNKLTVAVPDEAESVYVVRKGTGKLTTDSQALAITITRREPGSSEEESSTEETTKKETTEKETTKETTKATTAASVTAASIIPQSTYATVQSTSTSAATIPANIVSEDTEEESVEETLEEALTEAPTTKPTVKEVSTQAPETTAKNDDDDIRKNAIRLIIIIAVIFVVICILIAVLFYLNEQKPKKKKSSAPKNNNVKSSKEQHNNDHEGKK